MRASKINQLNKALVRITNLATELNNANYNNCTEIQIEKIEDREEKACNRAYEICKTMTEEEYNATDFGYVMCMDYEDAIS